MPTSQEKKPGLKVRLAQFAKEKYPAWINGGDFEVFAMTQGKKASNVQDAVENWPTKELLSGV